MDKFITMRFSFSKIKIVKIKKLRIYFGAFKY